MTPSSDSTRARDDAGGTAGSMDATVITSSRLPSSTTLLGEPVTFGAGQTIPDSIGG